MLAPPHRRCQHGGLSLFYRTTCVESFGARSRIALLKVIYGLDDQLPLERSVLTIGNFDGVHRGHQRIIQVALEHARAIAAPAALLTFEPHPLNVVRPDHAPERLTLPDQKLEYLEHTGIDITVVAASTKSFLSLTPEQFIRDIIVGRFRAAHVVEGVNFGFGRGRKGSVETLRQLAGELTYKVDVVEPVEQQLESGERVRVSSSMIRQVLGDGQVALAARALGRPYALRGQVVTGSSRGHKLGFPTANLTIGEQLIPAEGVYAGWSIVRDKCYLSAISIGRTPTFEGTARQVEAYLLDFEGDLYGLTIDLQFFQWLRGQRKFESADDLVRQIDEDVGRVRGLPPSPTMDL